MKRNILIGVMALLAGSLSAADSSPKNDVTGAAAKLAEKSNYSWKTTVVVPEDAPFKPGPTEGKTEKGAFTYLKMSFGDNDSQVVIKGDKIGVTGPEGWRSVSDVEKDEGWGPFFAAFLRNIKTPAVEATNLLAAAKELKKDGDAYAGDLTEDGVKRLLTIRIPGGEAPTVSDAKGSVKFWVKDGVLSKYEFKLKGMVNFGGNEFPNDRTTTVEIKDVGTTKVDAPEEGKKKAS